MGLCKESWPCQGIVNHFSVKVKLNYVLKLSKDIEILVMNSEEWVSDYLISMRVDAPCLSGGGYTSMRHEVHEKER